MAFNDFQARIKEMRNQAKFYGDAEELEKALNVVESAWKDAADAAQLAEIKQVKAAIEATQRSADVLAYNILFCDTGSTSPQTLLAHIVKFQALEQVRGAFSPAAAIAIEESVKATLDAAEIQVKSK